MFKLSAGIITGQGWGLQGRIGFPFKIGEKNSGIQSNWVLSNCWESKAKDTRQNKQIVNLSLFHVFFGWKVSRTDFCLIKATWMTFEKHYVSTRFHINENLKNPFLKNFNSRFSWLFANGVYFCTCNAEPTDGFHFRTAVLPNIRHPPLFSPSAPVKSPFGGMGVQTKITFAMRHWEKSKKEIRRSDDRDIQLQDHKKKKLKPTEKTKYRLRGYESEEE